MIARWLLLFALSIPWVATGASEFAVIAVEALAQRQADGLSRQERQCPAVWRPVEVERRVIRAPVDDQRIGSGRAGLGRREDVDPGVARTLADDGDPHAVRRPARE